MRKYVTKEYVYTSLVFAQVEVVDGQVQSTPQESITVLGRVSDTRKNRIIKKHFGNKTMLLLTEEETTEKYRMSIADFMKYGELVESDTDEEEEEEEEEE